MAVSRLTKANVKEQAAQEKHKIPNEEAPWDKPRDHKELPWVCVARGRGTVFGSPGCAGGGGLQASDLDREWPSCRAHGGVYGQGQGWRSLRLMGL